jgi:hypothetical protein
MEVCMKKLGIPAALVTLAPAGALFFVFVMGRVSASALSSAATQAKPEILIVGTYHLANPGHDIFNTSADDVLSPKRQAEVAELLAVLKRFRPTKIAIESNVYDDTRKKQYADYLAGKYTLTRNEIDQVGFRLAKELGMKTVYPVDYDGDFPWQRLVNFARATGKSQQYDQLYAEMGGFFKKQNEFLPTHTILETLLFMNADDRVVADVGFYFREVHFGEPGDYAGADLLTSWYQRNMRIYTNITNLIESPDERILVIYGSGHLGWLRQASQSDPTVQLRKLAEFASGG